MSLNSPGPGCDVLRVRPCDRFACSKAMVGRRQYPEKVLGRQLTKWWTKAEEHGEVVNKSEESFGNKHWPNAKPEGRRIALYEDCPGFPGVKDSLR